MLIWAKSSTLKSRLGLWPPSYPATHRPTLPPIHHLHVPPLPATCHLPAQLNLAKPNLYFQFQLETRAWQQKGQEKVTFGISFKPSGMRGTSISSGGSI